MELKCLPNSTVRLIGSSQVITSVYSVVKELIENAIDARSTSLEIKLENYGLDRVEVRDNGSGIKQYDIPLVVKRYHTSKITSFSDLENLMTYGFRGEALGSLCAVSDLSITSKTGDEEFSQCVTFDHHGNVTTQVPSHLGQELACDGLAVFARNLYKRATRIEENGTIVCATNLFKNMPVRRQFYNSIKKKKEELKKVEDLLMCYGAIRPGIRLSLKHGKDLIWQKNVVSDVRAALFGIIGKNVVSQMEQKSVACGESQVTMEMFLPTPNSDVQTTSRSAPDRCFIFVNRRPLFLKDLDKVIRHHYCQHHLCENRCPIYFVSIDCPSSQLDVNLDPNKTQVMLHNKVYNGKILDPARTEENTRPVVIKLCKWLAGKGEIVAKLTEILEELYGPVTRELKATDSIGTDGIKVIGSYQPHDFDTNVGVQTKELHYTGIKQPADKSTLHGNESENIFTYSDIVQCESSLKQVKSSDSSEDAHTGIRISFYEGHQTGCCAVDVLQKDNNSETDQNQNVTEKLYQNVKLGDDEIGIEIDCDNGLMQGAKGDFSLTDRDLGSFLVSQSDEKQDSYGSNKNIVAADIKNTSESKVESLDEVSSRKSQMLGTDPVEWSKGQSLRQKDGQNIEPVKLLVPELAGLNKRPPSPTTQNDLQALTPPSKKRVCHVQVDQPRIYECVVNSSSDKHSAGFVAFSKQVRPKVVEENHLADYDTVTKIVLEKWARLSDADKEHFYMMGKEELQVLKKTVSEKKKLSQKIKPKTAVQIKSGLPTIKDQLLATSKREVKASPQIRTVRTHFNLANLKQLYSIGIRQSQTQVVSKLHLIGPLKFYNAWVCCHDHRILLLNPHRVEETLLYRELLDKHVLPVSTLENPIRLSESNLGTDLYKTLLTLFPSASPAQTYIMVDDKRLVSNGIQVRKHVNQDDVAILDLVGLSRVLPLLGLPDLVEILDLICHAHAICLNMARPLKVINYLQGEAVRMVRQRPLQRSREDMLDLLEQMMSSLPDPMNHCLHNKPFFHEIFDLRNVTSERSS